MRLPIRDTLAIKICLKVLTILHSNYAWNRTESRDDEKWFWRNRVISRSVFSRNVLSRQHAKAIFLTALGPDWPRKVSPHR
jgi:hypothetical protein